MNKQDEHIQEEPERTAEEPQAMSTEEKKKPFVEPVISAAINVFDATTFFLQGSGVGTEDL